MGSEYELKFRATPACQTVIADKLPGSWQTISMQTTYYDTPSGSLSAKRYMLRKRLENGTSVCTLKTAGKGNLRGEWEVAKEHITDAIVELCKLGCPSDLPSLCAEGLIPVCGAEFVRKTLLLEQADFTAELALDQGILFGKRKQIPMCEIELELKSGSQAALDAFAADFAASYSLQPEKMGKFSRALALSNEA